MAVGLLEGEGSGSFSRVAPAVNHCRPGRRVVIATHFLAESNQCRGVRRAAVIGPRREVELSHKPRLVALGNTRKPWLRNVTIYLSQQNYRHYSEQYQKMT